MLRSLRSRLAAEALVAAALLGWWLMSRRLPAMVLPSPEAVLARLITLFTDPRLGVHWLVTLARVATSVAISLALGFGLALLAHASRAADAIIRERILVVLNALPSIGWAILAVIWFKVSNFSVMFVQVMILLPFCITNFLEGLRSLDREVVEMARSFTRTRRRILLKVTIPMLLPFGIAALRASYGICWKIALVAELFGARTGLGYLMMDAQANGDAATVLATCFAIVLLFVAGERLLINPIARFGRRDLRPA